MHCYVRHAIFALSALLLGCAGAQDSAPSRTAAPKSAPVAVAEAGAAAKPEKDSRGTTASGATFTVPAGWTLTSEGPVRLLDGPEPDLHVAIVDSKAPSADAAVVSAWLRVQPNFRRPLKTAQDWPTREGWEQWRKYEYETSPNERMSVSADAFRKGDVWSVVLYFGSDASFDRRRAQVKLFADSFWPRGYEKESFKGKTAHVLEGERLERIKKFVEHARKEAGVPGVALSLLQGGKVVFEGGFGVRELGQPAPVDANTLFLIASNTKSLSTLLLAKLVDEGKIRWDTPVTNVYPNFRLGDADTTKKVLVKHLVCACTGLPRQDYEWLIEFGNTKPKDIFDRLASMQPTTRFGETYQYSNLLVASGGFVAGHAAYPDRELGAAYDEAMRTRVFEPLGMKRTTFDFARAAADNHASPHADDVDGKPTVGALAGNRAVIPVRPSAGAWSSVHELSRYIQMELAKGKLPNGERYVSEANLLARYEPQVSEGDAETYGLGLKVNMQYGTPLLHHGGSMFGFKSDMFWLPEYGVGGVILTNSSMGYFVHKNAIRKVLEVLFDGRPRADDELAAVLGQVKASKAAERKRLTVPPDSAAIQALAKRYTNPVLGELAVVAQGSSTAFDFGEWKSSVVSRTNDDGTTSFLTVDPGVERIVLVVSQQSGKRALVLRDNQHEYVFVEK